MHQEHELLLGKPKVRLAFPIAQRVEVELRARVESNRRQLPRNPAVEGSATTRLHDECSRYKHKKEKVILDIVHYLGAGLETFKRKPNSCCGNSFYELRAAQFRQLCKQSNASGENL